MIIKTVEQFIDFYKDENCKSLKILRDNKFIEIIYFYFDKENMIVDGDDGNIYELNQKDVIHIKQWNGCNNGKNL